MSDTTTRLDVLLAGLAVTAAGVSSAQAPSRFRVALTGDYEHMALKAAAWNTLGEDAEVVSFNQPFRSSLDTVRALRNFDAVALMRERVPMPREVIEQLPRLKLIVFSGLMNATLDHKAAAERNIIVCRALGMGGNESASGGGRSGGGPAELSLALMLACAWHIPQSDALLRRGGWIMQPDIPLKIPLAGRTLGIVGYGGIGARVGRYGQALGMRVLGFSRSLTEEASRADGVTKADLETLLRTSDVISIHLPLTAATRGMIGPREIGWMKHGVILINTARGPIIDEPAMIEAVRTGKIAMGGFDVYNEEPLPSNHPLLKLPNVVMTPHIGYVSEAAIVNRYKALLEVLVAYRQGKIIGCYTPAERDMVGESG
jgi:phosphoglycerate dehydrogenase-like enzyme